MFTTLSNGLVGQPWSDGRVVMLGVSYLAISQYGAAALRPPALRAIVPWEGFTDPYRDFAMPGGVREVGFMRVWGTSADIHSATPSGSP